MKNLGNHFVTYSCLISMYLLSSQILIVGLNCQFKIWNLRGVISWNFWKKNSL